MKPGTIILSAALIAAALLWLVPGLGDLFHAWLTTASSATPVGKVVHMLGALAVFFAGVGLAVLAANIADEGKPFSCWLKKHTGCACLSRLYGVPCDAV